MTLSLLERDDGKYVVHDTDNPDAWMVLEPDMIMQDTQLAPRRDWTPGRPDTHPSSRTELDDWE